MGGGGEAGGAKGVGWRNDGADGEGGAEVVAVIGEERMVWRRKR
jgi:hypothetical protein